MAGRGRGPTQCVWLVLVLLVLSASQAAKKPARSSHLVGRVLGMEKCHDRPSALVNSTSEIHQGERGLVSIDVDYYVSRAAQYFSKFDLQLVKCREAVSFNSCEYFQSWTYSLGVCDVVGAPGTPWSDSIDKMQPPWKCPFKKGFYQVHNATANVESLAHLPIKWEGNVWRVTVQFFNEKKELHLCWTADVEFVRVNG